MIYSSVNHQFIVNKGPLSEDGNPSDSDILNTDAHLFLSIARDSQLIYSYACINIKDCNVHKTRHRCLIENGKLYYSAMRYDKINRRNFRKSLNFLKCPFLP